MGRHGGDLFYGDLSIAKAIGRRAHHAVGPLSDDVEVVVTLRDLGNRYKYGKMTCQVHHFIKAGERLCKKLLIMRKSCLEGVEVLSWVTL